MPVTHCEQELPGSNDQCQKGMQMNKVNGAMILDEIVERLNIDLPGLVAGSAFWSPANT